MCTASTLPNQKGFQLILFRSLFFFLSSFALVSFGGPTFSEPLSCAAAAFGYALFWQGLKELETAPFWPACGWFVLVQAVQLNWLLSTHYMGPLILIVYAFLAFGIALQFGLLTHLLLRKGSSTFLFLCALAGVWVWMEWIRLFFLTGFPWNPVGLALVANRSSIQFVSVLGIYGLSFWVIFVNLLAFSRRWKGWVICALIPYGFGYFNQLFWESRLEGKPTSVALLHTAFTQEEKEGGIPPIEQWRKILTFLSEKKGDLDYIVLPETALPGGVNRSFYPLEEVKKVWLSVFGVEPIMPPLASPYAGFREGALCVSNAFWAQAISNHFESEVLAGFDHRQGSKVYNGAFHFIPGKQPASGYAKRILVPIGEYLPFTQWNFFRRFIEHQFRIGGSLTPGDQAKVFHGKMPLGISICSEEVYGHLLRDMRKLGAEIFINVSNDGWFPDTTLPQQHLTHGRIRAAENGVCALRACNRGIAAAIDPFGQPLEMSTLKEGALFLSFKIRSYPTLYTIVGDSLILAASSLFPLLWFSKRRKTLP